jgi:gamma-glutamylcyclotransferase (GGCT)/AIG2-like uncharacterized protein YtfP
MKDEFLLFVYGTLQTSGKAAELLHGCAVIKTATVAGTLYDIDGEYPALVLGGSGRVHGEIRTCPASLMLRMDDYEGVPERLFRRVGVQIGEHACWTYVAGPKLARRLLPARRVSGGTWSAR